MINKTQLKPQIKISASLAYVDKKHHPAKRYSKRALRLQNGGIDTLHFDIKTKAGIENMGIGGGPTDDMFNADLIKRIRDDGFTPPIDVHLMDYEIPELEIDRLSDAGASAVYIHHHSFRETEAVVRALRYIRGKKLESGTVLSVGFGTEQLLSDMLDHSDLVALTAGREGW